MPFFIFLRNISMPVFLNFIRQQRSLGISFTTRDKHSLLTIFSPLLPSWQGQRELGKGEGERRGGNRGESEGVVNAFKLNQMRRKKPQPERQQMRRDLTKNHEVSQGSANQGPGTRVTTTKQRSAAAAQEVAW